MNACDRIIEEASILFEKTSALIPHRKDSIASIHDMRTNPLPMPKHITAHLMSYGTPESVALELSNIFIREATDLREALFDHVKNAACDLTSTSRSSRSLDIIGALTKRACDMYAQTLKAARRKFVGDAKSRFCVDLRLPHGRASQTSNMMVKLAAPLLDHAFSLSPLPCREDKECLASLIGVSYKQIHVWFQNARYRRTRAFQEGKPIRRSHMSATKEEMHTLIHGTLKTLHSYNPRLADFLPIDSWYGAPKDKARPVLFEIDDSMDEYSWDEEEYSDVAEDPVEPPIGSSSLLLPFESPSSPSRVTPSSLSCFPFPSDAMSHPFTRLGHCQDILSIFDPLGSHIQFADNHAPREQRTFPLAYWPRSSAEIESDIDDYVFPEPIWRRNGPSGHASLSPFADDVDSLLKPLSALRLRSRARYARDSRRSRKRSVDQLSDSSSSPDEVNPQSSREWRTPLHRRISPLPNQYLGARQLSASSSEESLESQPSSPTLISHSHSVDSFTPVKLFDDRPSKRRRSTH
ncbi:hypothetical protein SISNIDRAFT_485703 [Sistotremastrum niveocremeum HHB9708]|uniref:Homeobox domain-containing protein n=1 Tax=Sistotremastrum niveocremeum HHB9708 TaxID=1314777 RepID=A0A164UQP5_9AGAM|nr:hypothetical protein SISNIDRAFT_485703 [Sistotremastrum niveocremeum HHB9708]